MPTHVSSPDGIAVSDEMYAALRPMLAVGDGDLWLMSTPGGQSGFFYETWAGSGASGDEWLRISVKATECERIPAGFLDRARGEMTAAVFAREFLCEFTSSDTSVFDRELIEAALDDGIPELPLRR